MVPTDDMITPEEAAQLLRVNTHTVYRALRAGKLPGGKVGHQWRIPRAELERQMKKTAAAERQSG